MKPFKACVNPFIAIARSPSRLFPAARALERAILTDPGKAVVIPDCGAFESHDVYVIRLRREHGHKGVFRDAVGWNAIR